MQLWFLLSEFEDLLLSWKGGTHKVLERFRILFWERNMMVHLVEEVMTFSKLCWKIVAGVLESNFY